MTSKKKIQVYSKVNKMNENTGMRALLGKRMTKKVAFMGESKSLEIAKLTVAEVLEIQEAAKGDGNDDKAGFNSLKIAIRMAVSEASDFTDDEFDEFPLDELMKLSKEIMTFSGIADTGK